MKNILVGLVAVIVIYFGYYYYNSAKIPEECIEVKKIYDETVDRFKSLNSDGSLTTNIEMLISIGEKWDIAIDSNQRYKRSQISEIKTMCLKNKTLLENISQQLDNIKQ